MADISIQISIMLIIGGALIILSLILYAKAGFGAGRQIAADDVLLVSEKWGVSGRPDRIVKHNGYFIPEEKKTSLKLYPSHRLQLAVYFLLVEEHYGKRPPYGFVVLGDGTRRKIHNTFAVRRQVKQIIKEIKAHRNHPNQQIKPRHGNTVKCRSCSMAMYCQQKLS